MTSKHTRGVVAALLVIATACGAPEPAVVASPTPPVTATAAPTPTPTPTPPPIWPLTGLPATDGSSINRRPLNVRMPNDPNARPHVGFAKADLVYEMIVEGGITRYAAVYHSQQPATVGPVRSYRYSDLYLTEMLQGVIVSSGATIEEGEAVTAAIRAGKLLSIDDQRGPQPYPYFRDTSRPAPNNLFVNMATAREAVNGVGGGGPVNVPTLTFVPQGATNATAGGFLTAAPATTVTIPFQRYPTTFTWDKDGGGYRRSQSGVRTVDPDGNVAVLAENVIVMWTDITNTTTVEDSLGSLGLDYRMTGTGKAAVFRDGLRMDGTWRRDGARDQFTFFNDAGQEVALSRGQSWIHFVYSNWTVTSTCEPALGSCAGT